MEKKGLEKFEVARVGRFFILGFDLFSIANNDSSQVQIFVFLRLLFI